MSIKCEKQEWNFSSQKEREKREEQEKDSMAYCLKQKDYSWYNLVSKDVWSLPLRECCEAIMGAVDFDTWEFYDLDKEDFLAADPLDFCMALFYLFLNFEDSEDEEEEDSDEEEECENCGGARGSVISEKPEALLLCQKCYEEE